jgi:Fur family peroxide stress response transcriptional regulator
MLAALERQGLRITPQRRAIVDALTGDASHPSAEDIHNQVLRSYPMISLATVYKTLALLNEIDEVAEVHVGSVTRYDGRNKHPHPHLVCNRCGTVKDAQSEIGTMKLGTWAHVLCEQSGYEMRDWEAIVFGVCSACQDE